MAATGVVGRGGGRRETGDARTGSRSRRPQRSQPSPSAGGGRGCGTSVENPRCARIFRMTDGSSIVAMSRIRPPHRRSEEHTSELQSHHDLVCRLLLEKKKKKEQNRDVQ